jgi:L-proline amide hydrolase
LTTGDGELSIGRGAAAEDRAGTEHPDGVKASLEDAAACPAGAGGSARRRIVATTREAQRGGRILAGALATEGFADFRGYRTWYRVTGDLASSKLPLVVLHGGPGCTHDYVDSFKGLAAQGRAVVHYDQLGNGRSTHLRDKGGDFWTVDLFLAELDNLLRHLGIERAYHVLGQSWGGMLGAEHAVRRPAGLRSLVIANSPASMELWVREANRLREALPPEVQETLKRHEAAGTTRTPEYQEAVEVFYARHVCRVVPRPDEVERTFKAIEEDPTVYFTMNGPSEFHVIGTLRHWSIIDRLDRIEVPVLLLSGKYDEATPATIQPYADRIKDVRWEMFEHSSHMPHVEETQRCLEVVGGFLDARDGQRA